MRIQGKRQLADSPSQAAAGGSILEKCEKGKGMLLVALALSIICEGISPYACDARPLTATEGKSSSNSAEAN